MDGQYLYALCSVILLVAMVGTGVLFKLLPKEGKK